MLNSSCFFSAVLTLVNKTTTVFLRRFGAFQQLVQPPEHFVICAHHSSFSFLPPNCKCFWTCINCFHTTHCCFI